MQLESAVHFGLVLFLSLISPVDIEMLMLLSLGHQNGDLSVATSAGF